MTRKRAIFFAVSALLVLLLGLYLWAPSPVPAGQEHLFTLSATNFAEFEKAFDASADVPRLVLLLSPT